MKPSHLDEQGRSRTTPALALLLLILLVAGTVYLYRHRNVEVGEMVESIADESKDAATTAKVKTALALSKRVSVFDIGIDSNEGIVVMSGEVPSKEVRALAEEIVSGTAGVLAVDNQLLVNEEVTADPERAEIGERVRDLELRARIAEQLAEVETGDLRVHVHDGVVTLSGDVEESSQSYRAELIALNTEGVREVKNKLAVDPAAAPQSTPDKAVAQDVELALYRSKAFDMDAVSVEVEQEGVVRLTGTVRSLAEKLLAERLAKEVTGVQTVVNALRVSDASADAQT